jgi:antitoxin VapB
MNHVSDMVPKYGAASIMEPQGKSVTKSPARSVSLFRNGANQAVRIPKEFEFPPGQVSITKVGDTLVLKPIPEAPIRGTAAALVAALQSMKNWPVITEPFPDVDEGLLPLDEIEL